MAPAIGMPATDPLIVVYQAFEGTPCGCLIENGTRGQSLRLFGAMQCSQGEAAAVRECCCCGRVVHVSTFHMDLLTEH